MERAPLSPRTRRWLLVAAVILAVVGVAGAVMVNKAEPWAHAALTRALQERFDSEVTLESLDLSFLPRPSAEGTGLTLRYKGRRDLPPLIQVGRFSAAGNWWSLPWRHVSDVTIEGLEISIPPGRGDEMPSMDGDSPADADAARDAETPGGAFTIGHLGASNARLSIMPKTAGKNPRVFDIFRLDMTDLDLDSASAFEATLTNPVPFGRIETSGTFGPWATAEPSATPVNGTFDFDADLGTIKGIAGALESNGRFGGPLSRIEASGSTHTPDFRIPKLNAAALLLDTTFDAVIDGTEGDVALTRVDATLGDSRITASGAVAGVDGVKGKRVVLDVTSDDAHIEDFLRLTVPVDPPLMTGALTLDTDFDLPPGEADVIDRLLLDGRVRIATARFTRESIQDKVDELSRRGRGRPEDEAIDDVASDLDTTFTMGDGQLHLKQVTYQVSGAKVRMAGQYGLESKRMDFKGEALLNATVSETQKGFKHYLLKPFDPLFKRKGAGTRLALDVSGTVDDPKFGVAVGRTLFGK
ncbi:MAG: AsmA-like C-terminal region-containing protein [Vicinamibacterales bacterium]